VSGLKAEALRLQQGLAASTAKGRAGLGCNRSGSGSLGLWRSHL